MNPYQLQFTRQAVKHIQLLPPKLKIKLKNICKEVISVTPYIGKKLLGELSSNYSYRLSIKDQIIYSIDEQRKTVFIKRARTHYGE